MKVPELFADDEYGEGDLIMPDDWQEHHPLLRADLLKGWIVALERHYNSAVVEGQAKMAIINASLKAQNEQNTKGS